MPFDVEGARKAGYSDAEIAGHLAQEAKFDAAAARSSGYSDSELIAFLAPKVNASAAGQIPGQAPGVVAPPATQPISTAPQTVGDKALGVGEAALATVTGMTGGAAGMVLGTGAGLAEQILSGQFGTEDAARAVEQSAAAGAQALTYEPRTPAGQEMTQAVGQGMQNLIPIAPIAPGMPRGVAPRAPAAVLARAGAEGIVRDVAGDAAAGVASRGIDAAGRVADLGAKNLTTLPRRALEALRKEQEPTPGTMGSAGAAGTDMAAQRVANAQSMPVPIQLTKGQATRNAAQLKFEGETAKLPEQGAPLRQRAVEQNDAILRNIDTWIDQTGAEAPSLRAVGVAVDRALVEQAKRDKVAVRVAYKAAEKAGEMEAPVTLQSVVAHLNDAAPEAATAPLLNVARARAVQLGIATEGPDGTLVPAPVPLKTAELYRQSVSRATDFEPTNVRQATIIKGYVDEATAGVGGDLYRAARKQRQRYAQNYEDRASIAKLLSTKRGTADRQVAFEDVFQHTVLKGSLDDVRNVRRVLQRAGADGGQAWRELQGQTMSWIRDEATKSVATDSTGNRVISPAALDKAVRQLDHDGRLEFIFGKKGAQQVRDLNELAQVVKTVPPEAGLNSSNTAATLLAAFADTLFSFGTGTPVPAATVARLSARYVRDQKLRRRINDALRDPGKRYAPGRTKPPMTEPPADEPRPRTIH